MAGHHECKSNSDLVEDRHQRAGKSLFQGEQAKAWGPRGEWAHSVSYLPAELIDDTMFSAVYKLLWKG